MQPWRDRANGRRRDMSGETIKSGPVSPAFRSPGQQHRRPAVYVPAPKHHAGIRDLVVPQHVHLAASAAATAAATTETTGKDTTGIKGG